MLEQQAVQQYKAQHGLNDSAPGNSLVDQQMAAINAQIVQARSDLAEKEAEAERVGTSAAAGNAERCQPGRPPHPSSCNCAASRPT